MKKIFTFLTVALAAMSMQAQQTISFAGLTADDVTADESEWTWNEDRTELSVAAGAENVMHNITVKGVVFGTKRATGDRFFRLQEAGLYANGTNVNITVGGLKKDQEVIFTLKSGHTTVDCTVAAVSGCTADAANPEAAVADGDFTSFKFVATDTEMTIKNSGTRFIISTIEIGEAPASDDPVAEVSETTVWTLTGANDGDKLNTENVVNYHDSGLFLRSNNADGSHSVSAVAVDASGQLSTGYEWSAVLAFQCPGSGLGASGVNGKDANAAAASGNDRCVAFKAAVDGNVYVAITTTSYKVDRELYIWSSEGEKVASLASNDPSLVTVNSGAGTDGADTYTYHWVELKAEVKAGNSYFIGGSNQNRIACIQFVKKDDDVSGVESLKSSAIHEGVMYNLSGQQVRQGYKGLVIVNGRKVLVK